MQIVILDDEIQKFIDYSVAHQAMNIYNPVQVEVIDEKSSFQKLPFAGT